MSNDITDKNADAIEEAEEENQEYEYEERFSLFLKGDRVVILADSGSPVPAIIDRVYAYDTGFGWSIAHYRVKTDYGGSISAQRGLCFSPYVEIRERPRGML